MLQSYSQAQFFQLSQATNIYSTTRSKSELFVASRRSLSILSPRECSTSSLSTNVPTTRRACTFAEIALAGVPDDSEFISFDVSPKDRIFVLALRQVQPLPGTMIEGSFFSLQFYGASSSLSSNVLSWTRTAEDCQRIDLEYTPFCMKHIEVLFPDTNGRIENIFLISGNDGKLHVYRRHPQTLMFGEIDAVTVLPVEMRQTEGKTIVSMDIVYCDGYRWSAFGCQSGALIVTRVPSELLYVDVARKSLRSRTGSRSSVGRNGMRENEDEQDDQDDENDKEEIDEDEDEDEENDEENEDENNTNSNANNEPDVMNNEKSTPFYRDDGPNGVLVTHRQLDGPIPHLHLFVPNNANNSLHQPDQTVESICTIVKKEFNSPQSQSIEFNKSEKKSSSKIDLVVSGAVGYGAVYQDLDQYQLSNPILLPRSSSHDSVLCTHAVGHQIFLGTYGQELLVYRSLENNNTATKDKDGNEQSQNQEKEYVLDWQRTFAYPIYSINVGDFDGDGIDELVVTTLQGVHVLKPDVNKIAGNIAEMIDVMEEIELLKQKLSR